MYISIHKIIFPRLTRATQSDLPRGIGRINIKVEFPAEAMGHAYLNIASGYSRIRENRIREYKKFVVNPVNRMIQGTLLNIILEEQIHCDVIKTEI